MKRGDRGGRRGKKMFGSAQLLALFNERGEAKSQRVFAAWRVGFVASIAPFSSRLFSLPVGALCLIVCVFLACVGLFMCVTNWWVQKEEDPRKGII